MRHKVLKKRREVTKLATNFPTARYKMLIVVRSTKSLIQLCNQMRSIETKQIYKDKFSVANYEPGS